ncbi:MAG: hypothetical protein HY911_05890 [Desulfobacterales bacterium]|nr:hypothetical protein [Desulfobacterales bacterium]
MKVFRKLVAILFTATAMALCIWCAPVRGDGPTPVQELTPEALDQCVAELKNVLANDPQNETAMKALGIAYHFQAIQGRKEATAKAVEKLKGALAKAPSDYETMCYLGSTQTMMAKTTWNPIKKLSYVNTGTALMDRAVKRAPDNITVRMTRGANSLALPSFLNRVGCAVEDYAYLSERIEKSPKELASIRQTVAQALAEARNRQALNAKAE